MRIMVKFAIPIDTGNAVLRSGKLEKIMHQIVEDLRPEAAYFYPDKGERSGFFVIDMHDARQVAEIAERFFFGLNARIDMQPVMTADDLGKAMAALPGIVQRYA